jgi:hypothetical protein
MDAERAVAATAAQARPVRNRTPFDPGAGNFRH